MANITFYRCKKCGSVVAKLNAKGCSPSCCGEPMAELKGNVTDGAKEKHVPDVKVDGAKIFAQVGSVAHPMLDEHYIEWIALAAEDRIEVHYLKPGDKPATFFGGVEHGVVYASCNLHGLWKAEV